MQTASANMPDMPAPATQPANLVELSIATPDGSAQTEAMTAATYAKELKIVTARDSLVAQEARARINTRIEVLKEARLKLTRPIDAAKQVIMDFFTGPTSLLKEAKEALDKKILTYDDEQKRIQREAQAKVENDARIERERLQAIADETKRKAEAEAETLRKQAADKAAAGDGLGAAQLMRKAEKTEEKAAAKVETFETRAASVVAPIIQSESTRASGSSFRDNWKWRLKDKAKINTAFLMTVTNDAAIDAIVKSMKGNAEAIAAVVGDGIEVYNDRGLASRRA
jgi:hypothetical protein